jgi:hypothetical protein
MDGQKEAIYVVRIEELKEEITMKIKLISSIFPGLYFGLPFQFS